MKVLFEILASTVVLVLLLGGIGAVEVFSECFEGNNFVLLDNTQKGNADQAQERCKSFGANLARITTKQQFDFVLNFILTTTQSEQNPPSQVWIGLRDFGNNNLAGTNPARFTFTDGVNGEDRRFINDVSSSGPWFSGQPNDAGGTQDCVAYNLETGKIGLADFDCGKSHRGLCRLPCPAPTPSPTHFPSTSPTSFPSVSPSKSPTPKPTSSPTPPTKSPTLAIDEGNNLLGLSTEVFAGIGVATALLVGLVVAIVLKRRNQVQRRRERDMLERSLEGKLEEFRVPKSEFAREIFYADSLEGGVY